MDVRNTIIAIVGVGLTLAALQAGLFSWLRADISSHSELLRSFEIKVATVEAIVEPMQNNISRIVNRLDKVERELAGVTSDVSVIQSGISEVVGRLEKVEAKVTGNGVELEAVQEKVSKVSDQVRGVEQSIGAVEKAAAYLRGQLSVTLDGLAAVAEQKKPESQGTR
jgi:chromosome segregation ATPase